MDDSCQGSRAALPSWHFGMRIVSAVTDIEGNGRRKVENSRGKRKGNKFKIIKRNQTVKGKYYFGMPTDFT